MSTTRKALEAVDERLAESMGQRSGQASLQLAPSPRPADVGRRPAPKFGRIATDLLIPDPSQPRATFDELAIERLASGLQQTGQLAPIQVRWSEPHEKWLIVAGERRWRAACLAGLAEVECCFREGELDESEVLRLQLVENLLRENLRPIEEARGFLRLKEAMGCSGKEVAAELSVPESKVSQSLALLRLPEDIQSEVEAGRIAHRVAYEITKAPTAALQRRLAREAAAGQLHIKDIQQRLRRPKKPAKRKAPSLTFVTEAGWKITMARRSAKNYYEVEEALLEVLEDVRSRIKAGIQIL